jgi:hypothetical protein
MMKKTAFIVCRLVPTEEAYEGKTNADVEKEIQEEMPGIPYVVRVEEVKVFNCIAGEPDASALTDLVIEEFKPVNASIGKVMTSLAEHGVLATSRFNAREGWLLVLLEKAELGGF